MRRGNQQPLLPGSCGQQRARQLIAGAEPKVKVKKGMKPLSVAVEEMYKGEVTILPEEITEDETSEDVE